MAPGARDTRYPRPDTRGFTLPELVVALALLSIGALALVAASASAIRAVADAESQIAATSAARNRVEQLASADCSALRDSAGTDSAGSVREWWRITASRNGAQLVTDSVEYLDRGATRQFVVQRLLAC